MAILLTQNQSWYTFCDLPKGQRSLQFVFQNETNQSLCEMFIAVNEVAKCSHGSKGNYSDHKCSCHSKKCSCSKCKRKRKYDACDCDDCRSHDDYDDCNCKCSHDHHEDGKKKHFEKPCSPRIKKIKVQTAFCADSVEYCEPSSKVQLSFESLLYGRCIPFHYPNNVFIITIELDQPLKKGDCIHFEPCNSYGAVRISQSDNC